MVAVCTIIKNENVYLKEWIDYHISLGISHFFLCEDIGSESHSGITKDYPQVTLIQYNSEIDQYRLDELGSFRQFSFDLWILDKLRKEGKYTWAAFIDVDEFIHLEDYSNIEDFIKNYNDFEGVYLSWKIFGASGRIEKPGLPTTEAYTKEGVWLKKDLYYAQKSIVNLKKSGKLETVHKIKDGVNVLKMKTPRLLCHKIAWIDHYFSKSWEDWFYRIFFKGDVALGNRKLDEFFIINPDINKEDAYDFIKKKYLDKYSEIPKIIHTWNNNQKIPQNQYPDYEIRYWDKNSENSSYQKIKILYEIGGIFFDNTNILPELDNLLDLPYIIISGGTEKIDDSIIGFRKEYWILRFVLQFYESPRSIKMDDEEIFYKYFGLYSKEFNIIETKEQFKDKLDILNIFKSFPNQK